MGLCGVGLLIYGLWDMVLPDPVTVEIIKGGEILSTNTEVESATILVDVSGAVQSPGVYKLPMNARLGDALVKAGGLSSQADREWVGKTLNLAKEVKDGEKIYIPILNSQISNAQISNSMPDNNANLININTASEGELDGLNGIGAVRAKAIIAARPYTNIEELVSKAKIPESVYEKIKDSIAVY